MRFAVFPSFPLVGTLSALHFRLKYMEDYLWRSNSHHLREQKTLEEFYLLWCRHYTQAWLNFKMSKDEWKLIREWKEKSEHIAHGIGIITRATFDAWHYFDCLIYSQWCTAQASEVNYCPQCTMMTGGHFSLLWESFFPAEVGDGDDEGEFLRSFDAAVVVSR